MSALRERALELAKAEIGQGETDGNNRGERIDFYRRTGRTGGVGSAQSWCAAYVSSCLRRAAAELQMTLPFETSGGAKRLVKNIVNGGGKVVDHTIWGPNIGPVPGVIICWNRGLGPIDWRGHVGFVQGYNGTDGIDRLTTIEANRGPLVTQYAYPRGLWRKRIYLVVTF